MIVQCDRCGTKYRVREDRLPAAGGNIKCPGCEHVFFVSPPSHPAPDIVQSPVVTTPADLVASGNQGGASPFDAATRQMSVADLAAGAAAIAAAGAAEPAPAEVPPVEKQSEDSAANVPQAAGWKLKTGFGLVYDFPDPESLQGWLGGRDDLSGYLASNDGGASFKSLDEFTEILTVGMMQKLQGPMSGMGPSTSLGLPTIGTTPDKVAAPKGPEPASRAPFSPGEVLDPSMPATGPERRLRREPEKPAGNAGRSSGTRRAKKKPAPSAPPRTRGPAKQSGEGKAWVKPAAIVGLLVLALVILQVGGVVDLLGTSGGSAPAPAIDPNDPGSGNHPSSAGGAPEAAPPPPPPRRKADDSLAPNRDGHLRDLLSQAKSEMSRRDYDKALLTLTSARSVAPEEPEVYRLLERAYTRKGDRDSARGARERYQQLRGRTSGAAPN